MSQKCNGVNVVHEEHTESSVEAVTSSTSDGVPAKKKFPLESCFKGYLSIPHVRLERYDITPYLNGHKRPVSHRKIKLSGGKNDPVHKRRLSQKCLVKLFRDDLEKLKANFQPRFRTPLSPASNYSDSEASNSTDMAVNCKICNKTYNSEKKLLKHQQNKHIIYKTENSKSQKRVSFSDHVIVHEVKEYHKCRKCPKIFEDYKSLKRHMKQLHKKRKCYICNYCSKNFVDRMFFKVHIKLHCDICHCLLPNRKQYLEHRRDVCRVFKLHQCKTCNESFFKIMDLKDHSYDHLDVCCVCDICKDQFPSKCAMAHHYSFLHSKKRPKELYVMRKMGTERLYLCKFCDKTSVERDVVENHVQSLPDLTNKAMTGYKDFYFCDQCMKKFATETDMLQHKWTHFLKTSGNSQTRPKSILTKHKSDIKTTYNISEKIPDSLRPFVVLEKVDDRYPTQHVGFVDIGNNEANTININNLKKAIVDPKSKKTLLSRHQCETCGKYFSSNYCLSRHISTQHEDFDSLRCKVCEEVFVWPSLLKSHKCIRLNIPEVPFDDARAEILFDNLNTQNGFDDLNIEENDDYMNRVDFEIPAPVVELRECDSTYMTNSVVHYDCSFPDKNGVTSSSYKLIMQEVPIEF